MVARDDWSRSVETPREARCDDGPDLAEARCLTRPGPEQLHQELNQAARVFLLRTLEVKQSAPIRKV
jgi:hypothetical protein